MQKFFLTLSILLLAAALIFVGITIVSPELLQNQNSSDNKTYESIVLDEGFNADGNAQSSSAEFIGSKKTEPTSAPRDYYQSPSPYPTDTPYVGGNSEQTQTFQDPRPIWDGYADKESFCRSVAASAMVEVKKNPPQVDQSDLPPELRVGIDYDAMEKGAYVNCMNDMYF